MTDIDKILFNWEGRFLSDSETRTNAQLRQEAKQAITELTLKQVLELIGEDEDVMDEDKEMATHKTGHNCEKARLRQSAERIWKI